MESYDGDYYQSPSYTIKPMAVGEFKLVDIKIVDGYGEIRPNETLSIYAPSGGTYLFEGIGKINGGAEISSDTAVVHVNSFIIRLS